MALELQGWALLPALPTFPSFPRLPADGSWAPRLSSTSSSPNFPIFPKIPSWWHLSSKAELHFQLSQLSHLSHLPQGFNVEYLKYYLISSCIILSTTAQLPTRIASHFALTDDSRWGGSESLFLKNCVYTPIKICGLTCVSLQNIKLFIL